MGAATTIAITTAAVKEEQTGAATTSPQRLPPSPVGF